MSLRESVAVLAVLAASGGGLGQSNARLIIMTSGVVSPRGGDPTATVEVYAAWDPPAPAGPGTFVFTGVDYDLSSSDGRFTGAALDLVFTGNDPGVPVGSRVSGASIGQIHLPPHMGVVDNPIKLAHYTWTTTDFTPRTVDLTTEGTSVFNVVRWIGSQSIDLIGDFTPGSGSIRVVPGAGTVGLLGVGGLVAVRRRRVL